MKFDRSLQRAACALGSIAWLLAAGGAHAQAVAPVGPPRPQMPFELSEAVWNAMETSDGYRNLPQQREVKVTFDGMREMEYTGSANRSMPKPAAQPVRTRIEIMPISERCTVRRMQVVVGGAPPADDMFFFSCGLLEVGLVGGTKTIWRLDRIEEWKGSLFPLRTGNRESLRTRMVSSMGPQDDATVSTACEVMGEVAAPEVDARLAGRAWRVHCRRESVTAGSNARIEYDDFYFEQLGVMLSSIGQMDAYGFSLPDKGTHSVLRFPGPYGSNLTTRYARYEWAAAPAYVAGSAAAFDAASLKVEDKTAQGARVAAIEQQRAAQAARAGQAQRAEPEERRSAGASFASGVFGGIVSKALDRNAATVNSALAGSGAVGHAVANAHSRLLEDAKAGITRETASSDEGRAGYAVGSLIASGGNGARQVAPAGAATPTPRSGTVQTASAAVSARGGSAPANEDFDALGSNLPKTDRYSYSCGRWSGEEMLPAQNSNNCVAELKRFMGIQCYPGHPMHRYNIDQLQCAVTKSRGRFVAIYRGRLEWAQTLIRNNAPDCNEKAGCDDKILGVN